MLVSRDNLLNKICGTFPFNLAKTEAVRILVEKSDVVYFKAGDLVFMEGASANNYYVIYEGEIEILVEDHGSLNRLNILHDGDYFGEDILKKKNIRKTSARAIKDTLLIKIPKMGLDDFINKNPEIARTFSIITKTYSRLFEFRFRGMPQETVYFIGNRHFITLFNQIIIITDISHTCIDDFFHINKQPGF